MLEIGSPLHFRFAVARTSQSPFPLAASLQKHEKQMKFRYFKKLWDESTGEELTDSWGKSTYYFETDENLNVVKQLQKFENGRILKYDEHLIEDELGFLSDQPLENEEFVDDEIQKNEFYNIWDKYK